MSAVPPRVEIDRDACRGEGVCVRRAPRSFALDAEGRAVPVEPPGDPESRLREAERCCPHFAIHVRRHPAGAA